MEEELVIALGSPQGRGRHAEDVPATKHGEPREPRQGRTMQRGVAYDASLAHVSAPDFELRLDERHDLAARREDAEPRRQHLLERDERHVDDREGGLVAEDARVQRARVAPLHHHDARVAPELRVELAGSDVDGGHAGPPRRAGGRGRWAGGGLLRPRRAPGGGPPRGGGGGGTPRVAAPTSMQTRPW